jgi:hypothetical protein
VVVVLVDTWMAIIVAQMEQQIQAAVAVALGLAELGAMVVLE